MIASEFSLVQMMNTAERELGAFLLAVSQTAGSDLEARAGALWLQLFEEADGLENNPERAIRQTTIRALAELTTEMNVRMLLAS